MGSRQAISKFASDLNSGASTFRSRISTISTRMPGRYPHRLPFPTSPDINNVSPRWTNSPVSHSNRWHERPGSRHGSRRKSSCYRFPLPSIYSYPTVHEGAKMLILACVDASWYGVLRRENSHLGSHGVCAGWSFRAVHGQCKLAAFLYLSLFFCFLFFAAVLPFYLLLPSTFLHC